MSVNLHIFIFIFFGYEHRHLGRMWNLKRLYSISGYFAIIRKSEVFTDQTIDHLDKTSLNRNVKLRMFNLSQTSLIVGFIKRDDQDFKSI